MPFDQNHGDALRLVEVAARHGGKQIRLIGEGQGRAGLSVS
jgi:hypothetical protein